MSLSVVFAGTPEFAVPSLQALHNDARYNLIGVITQSDKPVGRKQVLTSPPVKQFAMKHKIPVYQPEKLKDVFSDAENTIRRHSSSENVMAGSDVSLIVADVMVVVAYGRIIPSSIISLFHYGVVNVHASLLPKYRGASPIQSAILGGDQKTGITIMQIDEKMDHGPIITQRIENRLSPLSATANQLHDELSQLGAHALVDVLADYTQGKMNAQPQDHTQATYCQKLTKESGRIDWSKSAVEIERMTRAYTPWPGAWTIWNGKRLVIYDGEVVEIGQLSLQTGMVNIVDNDTIIVACGDKTYLKIKTLQVEGRKVLPSSGFLHGVKDFSGCVLI